jgi:hypothetical protein
VTPCHALQHHGLVRRCGQPKLLSPASACTTQWDATHIIAPCELPRSLQLLLEQHDVAVEVPRLDLQLVVALPQEPVLHVITSRQLVRRLMLHSSLLPALPF